MKRWIALLLALVMCLSLVSCGGSTEDESTQEAETETTQEADADEEEASADEAEETESADEEASVEEDSTEEDTLIRTTQYGQVQGVDQDGVQVYYGIPYGADPVGELRWAEPTAPESWDDVLDCTEKEEIALQMATVYNSDGTASTALFFFNDWVNMEIYTT
ncbi:MAG: carboxylesterase family protein, partial [Clostridiales bacterium]|nr:carboxylesterase family protein [Clostridiales bacterium]